MRDFNKDELKQYNDSLNKLFEPLEENKDYHVKTNFGCFIPILFFATIGFFIMLEKILNLFF